MKALERVLGLSAGLALFTMMGLTFVDVIARKLFASSVPGGVEVTELLMLAVIFAAMPLASLRGEHIVFDLLDAVLPSRLRALQHRVAHLVCVVVLAGAAWLVNGRATRAAEYGDSTAQLGLGLAGFQYATAALLVLTALMHLVLALRTGPSPDASRLPVAGEKRND
jgi:TRAP-type C4-dicarboxylate transport system permease small subunit